MHVYADTYTPSRTHAHTRTYTHTRTRTSTHTHTCTCIYAHTHTNISHNARLWEIKRERKRESWHIFPIDKNFCVCVCVCVCAWDKMSPTNARAHTHIFPIDKNVTKCRTHTHWQNVAHFVNWQNVAHTHIFPIDKNVSHKRTRTQMRARTHTPCAHGLQKKVKAKSCAIFAVDKNKMFPTNVHTHTNTDTWARAHTHTMSSRFIKRVKKPSPALAAAECPEGKDCLCV